MKLSLQAQRLIGQPMFAFKKQISELEKQGKDIVHLDIGDSHFNTDKKIKDAVIKSINDNETHYTNSSGIDELREAIGSYLEEEYGVRIYNKEITILPANSAIDFVIRCLCDTEDEVLITDPCFSTYESVLKYLNQPYKTMLLSESQKFKLTYKLVKDNLTEKTKLLIINSPSNPTGAVIDNTELLKIYDLARMYNFHILSDEVYAGLVYKDYNTSMLEYDVSKRVIVLRSFSKEFAMSGFRLGYVIAKEELSQKLGLMMETIFSCMPKFTQKAGIAALKNNKRIIKEHKAYYKKCRDFMYKELNLIKGLSCIKPEGAFYIFLNIKNTGMSDFDFQQYMLNSGVALLAGSYFGKNSSDYVRICYANEMNELEKAVERIKKALC